MSNIENSVRVVGFHFLEYGMCAKIVVLYLTGGCRGCPGEYLDHGALMSGVTARAGERTVGVWRTLREPALALGCSMCVCWV